MTEKPPRILGSFGRKGKIQGIICLYPTQDLDIDNMALTDEIRNLKMQLEESFYALREEMRQERPPSDEAPYIEFRGQVHDTGEAAVADIVPGPSP